MIVCVTAYKRPGLLRLCLQSILAAKKPDGFQGVMVSADWHSSDMAEQMYQVCESFEDAQFDMQSCRMGIANNTRHLINRATEHSYKIVALEEDSFISPDALLYASWALRQDGYVFANLHSKMDGSYRSIDAVHEDNELRGAFGWAFNRGAWRSQLEPHWNGKIRAPYGFDWQITHLCYREKWKVLTPEISRVRNTGREMGTYDTPENWDRTQKDVKICESIPDKYRLVDHPDLSWSPPDWVQEEMRP
ncbi:MAG TPA: hypothetical protein VJQ59_16955 [Candidatus Sulfotelmatobacter sp.]|nr:hypothetical protein [Candidatus Sulfotelmatobacter sp.]